MYLSLNALGVTLPGGKADFTWSDPLAIKFQRFDSVGTTVTALLPYLFVFGGLILFVMLLVGGFEIMTGATSEEKVKAGSERIKNALFGFLLLFGVYWLAQIAQVLFKIQIL